MQKRGILSYINDLDLYYYLFSLVSFMSAVRRKCIEWQLIEGEESQQELLCSICLQMMAHPYRIDCGHVFGVQCIKSWAKKHCPLCRMKYSELSMHQQLTLKAQTMKAHCQECKKIFPVQVLRFHQKTCQKHRSIRLSMLQEIVNKEKGILELKINPHLRQSHAEIWQQHVKEWKWLSYDSRDWKWWWWSNNPWWGQPCPQCNDLWHEFENEVQVLEEKRIAIINELEIIPPEEQCAGFQMIN